MIFDDSEVIKNQKHAKLINQQKSSNIQITLWASWCDSNIICFIHLVLKSHQEKSARQGDGGEPVGNIRL